MPGLCQGHELQMAVDFPQVFDVPDDLGIAVIQVLAEQQRCLDTCLGVCVPPRREAERSGAQREHIEPSLQYPISRARIALPVKTQGQVCEPRFAAATYRLAWFRAADADALDVVDDLAAQPETNLGQAHGP